MFYVCIYVVNVCGVAMLLCALGNAYSHVRDFGKAESLLHQAINIVKAHNGELHPVLGIKLCFCSPYDFAWSRAFAAPRWYTRAIFLRSHAPPWPLLYTSFRVVSRGQRTVC